MLTHCVLTLLDSATAAFKSNQSMHFENICCKNVLTRHFNSILQVDSVTAAFKSKTTIKELKFQQFCLGWSGHDLGRTERIAEKPSLLFARLEKVNHLESKIWFYPKSNIRGFSITIYISRNIDSLILIGP